MRHLSPHLIAALFFATTLPASTAEAETRLPSGFSKGLPVMAVAVSDGDTLTLDDGRQVRLVGIQAPKLPLGRPGFKPWPLGQTAKTALIRLARGYRLTPHFGGARADRHGRILAHLTRDDGRWLQGEMLALGLARVYSFADNRAAVSEMYAIERRARANRRGIWKLDYYRIIKESEAHRYVGSFQLVEGRILNAAVARGRGYLNFGENWRQDFTIAIPKRALNRFRAVYGRRLDQLSGKTVRVRGWLRRYNGPMIEATHPEQIEVLTP